MNKQINFIKKYVGNVVEKIKSINIPKLNNNSILGAKVHFAILGVFLVMVIGIILIGTPYKQSIGKNPIKEDGNKASVDKKVSASVSSALKDKNEYVGFISKELASLGINLKMVENPSKIIEGFKGKMYTKETTNNIPSDFSTLIRIDNKNIDIKKVDSFFSLTNNPQFTKSSDLNGDSYYVGDSVNTKFFTRGIQSVLLENGNIFYVFIASMNDYEYCKGLQISMLDGITIDSTIVDVVNTLGEPKYIDVYEVTNEKPYILCYYVDESKSSEISLIFVCDENTKNGYYLSKVTISITENN